jgi:hypothetical protein
MFYTELFDMLNLLCLLDSCEESTANASKRRKMALIISVSLAVFVLCIIFYICMKYAKVRKRKTTADLGKILNQFNFYFIIIGNMKLIFFHPKAFSHLWLI